MLPDPGIRQLLDSYRSLTPWGESEHPTLPAALPDASLDFLVTLARNLQIASVFEFGSGQSTLAFLRAGYTVTSLEDSAHWMEQTTRQLSDAERSRHTALVRPLRQHFHGLIPMQDWAVDPALATMISQADLILVDSPYYAPFRESTLWSALRHNDHAVVVLDDTRIPTLARFCDRLAQANPPLAHVHVPVGHGFDLFARLHDQTPLRRGHSPVEIAKGWRRFFRARRPV